MSTRSGPAARESLDPMRDLCNRDQSHRRPSGDRMPPNCDILMASIPVANIYYLLCYAWNEFAPRQMDRYAAEDFPDTLHLFSRQLIIGLESLHQRGFETGYIPLEESTSTPRGRIHMAPSIR